ncbi:hypothetical protein PAPYR_2813 [Paratrimastix pyriformis]|uniref:Uncharacterized protein n=1 Tax=Paratrimastix pyriformis TaxID=342808 RepID=A0ABQ8UP51_9EUKA|nr:hypothetical protein PAPYR_2813 [Paratrimastix pyriformis]
MAVGFNADCFFLHLSRHSQHTTPDNNVRLGLLPRELLLALFDAAPLPLQAYCQLIGLTHDIRTAIRGAPRVLSFQCPVPFDDDEDCDKDRYCMAPCLPADALAAIVGPCKGLVRLTLPNNNRHHPSVLGCGLFDDLKNPEALEALAEEAFGGHSQLAVLEIPGAATFGPAICSILRHLPGLEEFHFLQARPLPSAILVALAAYCPKLRVLHIALNQLLWDDGPDFTALKPLAGTLRELIIPEVELEDGSLSSLIAGLPFLERLEVKGGDIRLLRPVAQQLIHLTTGGSSPYCLDEAGICRLESLASDSFASNHALASVMTACRDTLRSFSLIASEEIAPGRELLDALGGLTHLTRLKLALEDYGLAAFLAALPPDLLENQLESLSLVTSCHSSEARAFNFRSRSLREVDLFLSLHDSCTLTLACPSLEELALPFAWVRPYEFVIDCPHLRSLKRLQGNLSHSTAMPELVEAGEYGFYGDCDPAWLPQLVAWAPPRLRHLSYVAVSQAMLAQLLAACPSLTSLKSIKLLLHPTTTVRLGYILRLPDQLEALDGSILGGEQGPAELRVEAPGLRALHLEVPSEMWMTLACPALVALSLVAVEGGSPSFVLAEGTDPPLRSLHLACHSSKTSAKKSIASLLAVLTRHGSHLQHVSLPRLSDDDGAWSEVAAALGQLPLLISLELHGVPTADLVLACPRLSHLAIFPSGVEDGVGLRSLVLDCPRLEELKAPFGARLERFELVGEASGSRHINYIGDVDDGCPWKERLEGRFPNAYVSTTTTTL